MGVVIFIIRPMRFLPEQIYEYILTGIVSPFFIHFTLSFPEHNKSKSLEYKTGSVHFYKMIKISGNNLIVSTIKMKFGQILVCCMTHISNMFLARC